MSRSLKAVPAAIALLLMPAAAAAQDAAAGEKVFARCKACHMVGEGAKNRVGPHLNDLFGRAAGTVADFRYSRAMSEAGADGLVWTEETLAGFLAAPRSYVKGTGMAFPGLKKEGDIADLAAYLQGFSAQAVEAGPTGEAAAADDASQEREEQAAPSPAGQRQDPAASDDIPTHGLLHLGRPATAEEVAAWDIDVRPDGLGLPEGSGTVSRGEALYASECASCHGDFGEAIGRWPVLAGGLDTLTRERPVKTVGSYWPYLSTVYDYIRRAMPFGNARSLSDDDVYALTAYVLYLNDIVAEEGFALSQENFTSIRMPNEDGFIDDNRASEPHYAGKAEPCMKDCKPGTARITMHAAVLDVTPDSERGEEAPAAGIE